MNEACLFSPALEGDILAHVYLAPAKFERAQRLP